jgi:hypothetical protein
MLELLSDNAKVTLFLLASILAVAGYILRQHVSRVTRLEAESVRKADLEAKHQENAKVLESIRTTVSHTQLQLETMGEIKHRVQVAEKDIQDLRDFKHKNVELAVRYIEYLGQEKPWNESKVHLEKLEKKIDLNEEKASESRHKSINDLQVILAGIEAIKAERKQR